MIYLHGTFGLRLNFTVEVTVRIFENDPFCRTVFATVPHFCQSEAYSWRCMCMHTNLALLRIHLLGISPQTELGVNLKICAITCISSKGGVYVPQDLMLTVTISSAGFEFPMTNVHNKRKRKARKAQDKVIMTCHDQRHLGLICVCPLKNYSHRTTVLILHLPPSSIVHIPENNTVTHLDTQKMALGITSKQL